MQLNLNNFNNNKSTKERINENIASNIKIKGLGQNIFLTELLQDIFQYYELNKGVMKLKDEFCSNCKGKLRRKGTYTKEITLPNGIDLLLTFYQYSCPNCKKKVDRKLESWFNKGERYSVNVKSDAIRLYLNNLSSYEVIREEVSKIYQKKFSKRTIRRWLKSIHNLASESLDSEKDFSGHFVYDEEYMKVFLGEVGKKNSTLTRIEVYLLLFRDAITGKVKLMLSDSLDKGELIHPWRQFYKWTIRNKIPFKTFTTDGKREYNALIKELNQEFELKIQHSYCIFHFKKNLYEVSNKYEFGIMKTKKQLPKYIINQIKAIENVLDKPNIKEYEIAYNTLFHQRQTFIKPLQAQIRRLKKYHASYTLHKKFPFLRTTNTCEGWFGQTKPEKVKKGYKTKNGLLNVLKAKAVKITNSDWKDVFNVKKDITDATNLMISVLVHKKELLLPA